LSSNDLQQLAERVRRGDRRAVVEWRQAFHPQVTRIVRRALRAGDRPTGFTRRILAAADATGPPRRTASREELIGRLARGICACVLRRLRPDSVAEGPGQDTVRD
jgi:hypothetical protein